MDWIIPTALFTAVFALPFGLLPSIFLFRDLANGIDSTGRTERLYRLTVWTGLIAAYAVAAGVIGAILKAFA